MKLLIAIILCFLGLLGRAAQPDVLRYESMKLDDLVREVLESADVSAGQCLKEDISLVTKRIFPRGEDAGRTFQRALALRKRFPYCVSVAMDPSAGRWECSIFHFNRKDGEVVEEEEMRFFVTVKNSITEGVDRALTVIDL